PGECRPAGRRELSPRRRAEAAPARRVPRPSAPSAGARAGPAARPATTRSAPRRHELLQRLAVPREQGVPVDGAEPEAPAASARRWARRLHVREAQALALDRKSVM